MREKRVTPIKIRSCIGEFLARQTSGWDDAMQGASYWSEGDIRSRLFSYLDKRLPRGSVHAEASIGKLQKNKRSLRVDLAIANPVKYQKWYKDCVRDMKKDRKKLKVIDYPERFLAMIELKTVWRGVVPSYVWTKNKKHKFPAWTWGGYTLENTKELVKDDVNKLAQCLEQEKTEDAHLILLDCRKDTGLKGGVKIAGNLYYGRADNRGANDNRDSVLSAVPLTFRKRDDFWKHLFLWHYPDRPNCVGYYRITKQQGLPKFTVHSKRR